jgi:GxxExxY protein
MKVIPRRKDLVHPELSYKIIGSLYEIYNELGYGYKEIYYQRALAKNFKSKGLPFKEQVPAKIKYQEEDIGKIYLDFLVEEKIILEIKRTGRFLKEEIAQVHGYLKATGLKLGIIAHFTRKDIKFKRILNLDSYIRKNS